MLGGYDHCVASIVTPCRVCGLGDDDPKSLVTPCLCTGGKRLAHVSCLLSAYTRPPASTASKKRVGAGARREIGAGAAGRGRGSTATAGRAVARTASVAGKEERAAEPTPAKIDVKQLTLHCPACKSPYVGEAAFELAKLRLELVKEHGGGGAAELAASHNDVAEVLKKQGRYEEAIGYYKMALEEMETIAEVDCASPVPLLATYHNNLASCLKNLGHRHFSQAEVHYKHALRIRETQLGPGHVDVATCKHNLAVMLQMMHRFEEAHTLATSALGIRHAQLGPDQAVSKLSQTLVERLTKDIHRERAAAR